MQKVFGARIGSLLVNPKTLVTPLLIILFTLLSACASSNVSRNSASNVDLALENADKLGRDFTHGDVVESYQNANQAVKGGILGGTAGVITGAVSSTVGFFPGTVAGLLLGATYGSYIDSQATLEDQLTNRGATMVELGDQILVVINSARIFDGMSAKFKMQAYSTLDLLSKFIDQYNQILVKISTYTDDIGAKNVNLALSKQQARSIEKYLASNGLNVRVLYAQGYGATSLVQLNTHDWGKSDNYRIEITLEKLHL